jgi:hypothetical protein
MDTNSKTGMKFPQRGDNGWMTDSNTTLFASTKLENVL